MGYLGKISAVVTANTVDFSRNLNGAASDLKRFAGAVERDITRATNDANKAFSSMLTPLQRLERALQAASSMKLSFRGFAGAIRDIDGLKQRLATLKNSQVGLVVRASGMRSINEFRAAIEGIEGRSLDLAVRFGGLEQLRTIRSELANLSQQSVAAVTADPGGLARLKELQETVRALAGDPLRLALRVGGAEALDKVEEQATGLSRKDLRLLMRIGGVEQLDRVVEELDRYDSPTINALVKFGGLAELDQALEQFRNATPEQINAVINVLGAQDIEDATNRMRALYSASKQVFEPLSASVATFNGLGAEIQAAFGPALNAVQKQADALKADIDSGVTVSEQRFNSLTNTVIRTAEAIDRIGEASRMIAGYNAGTSFAFTQPEALAAINRAKQLQEDALKLSPQELRQGQFAFRSGVIEQELQELARLQANRDAIVAQGPAFGRLGADRYRADLADADNAISEQVFKVNSLADAWQKASRAVRANRAEQEFLQAESLPFVDVGFVQARAVDERQRQLQSQAAQIAVTRDQLASSGFAAQERLRSTLPFVDVGFVQARAVDERQRQDAILRESIDGFVPLADLQASAARTPRNFSFSDIGLNAPLTDSTRQIGVLIGQVNSLESALEGLPISVRVGFVPALEAAKNELLALRNNADATAEEIAAAEARVRGEQGRVRNAVSVQGIRDQFGDFDEFINTGRIRAAGGELEALRGILGRVGAQASGPAVQAFNRFRDAVALSLDNPGNAELSAAVDQARNQAVAAASQIQGAGSQRRIRGQLRRAGDVQRFGADNISLALNQAAFAIDDFFSVQGDASQRIRAVQNNLTQLAFILGGTTGLFIGLGVAIAAQAGIALVKWINNGRTAEDQTKALNESLARQKTLVEELAGAFASLGDSIAERAFSEPAQQARAFQKQLQEIRDRQKELRESNVVDLDPAVQRERANQNRLRRELESETDIGRRTAIEAQIRASQDQERQLAEAALQNRPTAADVVSAINEARRVVEFDRSRRTDADPRQFTRDEIERRRREAVAGIDVNAAPDDVDNLLEQRRALERQIADLTDDATRRDAGGAASGPENIRAAERRNELEGLLASIELPIRKALDDLSDKILESSFGLSLAIEQAQDDVTDAIRRGVAGAAEFQAGLDNTAKQLDAAQKRLRDAQEIRDPNRRTEEVRRAEAEVRDLELRRDAINEQSREVRLTTGRGGERTEAALSAVQGNERFANEYGRLVARLRDVIDRETKARSELDQAIANNDEAAQAVARAELEAASAASDLAAATAEAALAMEQALARIRKIGDDALRGSEQIADDAQKRLTEDPTAENLRERDAAEQQLIRDRERVAVANNALDRARSEALRLNDPEMVRINTELEQIERERKRLSDEAAQTGVLVDPRDAERLANREAQLQAEREERLRQLTQGERANLDAIAQEIAAREKMIAALEKQRAFDEEVERRRNPQGDALRGLDLAETPGQRAARETEQGILDIDAAFREQGRRLVNDAGGLFDIDAAEQQLLNENERNRQDAIRRFAADQQRAAAPAIFGLADSVQNAVLQGPSRAALNVSDISTDEGARELNRLLRGEDSARDQNLIELQKQSTELAQVNTKLTALANRVGVAL